MTAAIDHTPRTRPTAAALFLAATLVASACTGTEPDRPGPPPGSPTVEAMAATLGTDVVTHLARGFHAETSTDIAIVPKPYNVVVRWSGRGLGTEAADPRTTHPTPWDYHQRVPLILYGPGYVRSGGRSERAVDVTDLPPTFAELTGSSFRAPEGTVLREALLPEGRRNGTPRVIVVVVYDGGGWNLLEEWPDSWDVQRRLASEGSVYVNGTIGSAPAVTTAIHANIGTGAYPRTHGLSEITGRLPDGSIGDTYYDEETDPRLMRVGTFGDRWDRENGNRAWVGMIGYESWHLGMMSRGARAPGGDRDAAVLWRREPSLGEFFVNQELYALPDYLPGEPELRQRLRQLDGEDGAIDGSWRGYDLSDPRVVPATPAFVRHQGDALLEMVEREPIGDDDVTDLLFVELKPTDFGGHLWNMVAPEERFVLEAQEELLGRLVEAVERRVGRDGYVVAVTADHGQTPKPETTGGLRVHPDVLGRRIDQHFGAPVVEKVTPSGVFLDRDVAEEAGVSAEDVARFIGDFRYGDGLPDDVDRSAIPADVLQERVFAGALPGPFLEGLTDADLRDLGLGEHREGDLTSPVRVPL